MVRRPSITRIPAEGNFASRLRGESVASWLGIALGVSFTLSFVTGLISHFMQHPPGWLLWPSRPINLYRLTQGIHVIGGIATIPLLLAKLWAVYPKLWQRPAVRSAGHAIERGLVFVLVGGALFQLTTGLFNIAYWYPFPFSFITAHYWTAYVVYGALVIHVGNEWAKVRRSALPPEPGRRGFLAAVAVATGVVAVATVGETLRPLRSLAILAPRTPYEGPQGLTVNRSARSAAVTVPADYRLTVSGAVTRPLSLSVEQLTALPQHTSALPISCVEGWSADATWAGIRLRDLMAMAGARDDARLRIESLQTRGGYATSMVDPPHWQDPLTLLALRLNGQTLHLDHGYPCRLIAPNRPGVLQTKWVIRVIVL